MSDYVVFLFELSDSLRVVGLNGADALLKQRFLGPNHFQVLSFVFLIGAEHELVLVDRSDRGGGQAGRLRIALRFHVASIFLHMDLQQSATQPLLPLPAHRVQVLRVLLDGRFALPRGSYLRDFPLYLEDSAPNLSLFEEEQLKADKVYHFFGLQVQLFEVA